MFQSMLSHFQWQGFGQLYPRVDQEKKPLLRVLVELCRRQLLPLIQASGLWDVAVYSKLRLAITLEYIA